MTVDEKNKPIFSVVTPNGDYKMNIDFSLVCRKRRTLDAVFYEMSRRGIINNFELGQKSIVKINEMIRKYGFETACALCFVDAKRFRQASMSDMFVNLYNDLVLSMIPEGERKHAFNFYNFGENSTVVPAQNGVDTRSNAELDFSHIDEVMKTYSKGTVEYKAAKYIKENPKARKLLLRSDFMSSRSFDNVKIGDKNILKLYNSKKGTGGPKAAFGDVQYQNEILKKAKSWTAAKAYDVGGIRIQSFSDYVPRMVFDYAEMIHDMASTKVPAHAYTKEKQFAMQFGLTGVKINMSLIPAIVDGGIAPGLDANGNYAWAGESFNYDDAVAIQNAKGYTENCGTIAVGVSKEHILKLLNDPNISMVIPYHKSGLNPVVAHMNKIDAFHDYTNDQVTKGTDGKNLKKDYNFNKAVRELGDAKAAANAYLKWCDDNGYTPKFDEFRKEENYYKLLEDFTMYDKDGNFVPQHEVRAVFPGEGDAFGRMSSWTDENGVYHKGLIEQSLEEDAIIEGRRTEKIGEIVDEISRTLPKTEAEIGEDVVEQAAGDVEAEYIADGDMLSLKEPGVNINDDEQDFTEQILNGDKTVETRYAIYDKKTGQPKLDANGMLRGSLDPYIGKRIGIVKTGEGEKALLRGYVTVNGKVEYRTYEDFSADRGRHLVSDDGSFGFDKMKVGYELSDPVWLDEPREITRQGRVARETADDMQYSVK